MKTKKLPGTIQATRDGGMILEAKEKTPIDIFLEEFDKDWPIEDVRMGFDDAGKMIEIFCERSRAGELRKVVPPKFHKHWTVVIGVNEGYGEDK